MKPKKLIIAILCILLMFFGKFLPPIMGLSQLVKDAGAALVGAGVVIEKGFQKGGDRLREQGIRVESLAIVDAMDEEGTITFR